MNHLLILRKQRWTLRATPRWVLSAIAALSVMGLLGLPRHSAAQTKMAATTTPPVIAVAPATAGTPNPMRTYIPRTGESLDQIISKTMPDSPLKIDLLRQAFVRANPQAFMAYRGGNAKPKGLPKGATLIVPDHNQLLKTVLSNAGVNPVEDNHSPVTSSAEQRKAWVRYP